MLVSVGVFAIEDLDGIMKTTTVFYDSISHRTYIYANNEYKEVYRNYLREDTFVLTGTFPRKVHLHGDIEIQDFKRKLISLREIPSLWAVDIMETDNVFEVWVHKSGDNESRMVQIFPKETEYQYMEDVVEWVYNNIEKEIKKCGM
jgi:hypothetical protein